MAETSHRQINGEFCSAEGGAIFASIDPATGKMRALVPKASAADTAGIVWVNACWLVSPVVPFGGSGYTVYGRAGGMDAPMVDLFVMR